MVAKVCLCLVHTIFEFTLNTHTGSLTLIQRECCECALREDECAFGITPLWFLMPLFWFSMAISGHNGRLQSGPTGNIIVSFLTLFTKFELTILK